MSLLDLFSGRASERAAKNNASAIRAGQTLAADGLTRGYGAATQYLGLGPEGGGALGALGSGFDRARGDITAAGDKTQALLDRAGNLYTGLTESGLDARNARADALGLNGAEGYGRAKAGFQSSLGYNAGLDEGLEAVMRTAATRRSLNGGNVNRDLFDYAANYQNRQSGAYLDRLNGAAGDYVTGLAGQAGALTGQANAAQSQGTALGALGQQLGAGQAEIFGAGANLQGQFGRDVANVQTGATQNTISNNNNLAASRNAAGANVLGALVGFGQLASGGAGGFAGRAAGGIRGGGGANVSPYANNPFLSFASNLGNMFS